LAPALPAAVDRFTLEGIVVGHARVAFSCQREGRRTRFEVEQVAGATPLNLVIEERPSGRVAGVWVDGEEAPDLRAAAAEAGVLRTQLILDRRRALEWLAGGAEAE
ncbi:MAG: hypothetical protein D6701_09960, partial [Gemmatimonadetes bacterium]